MKALRMFLWMTILTGLIYPLLITAVGQFAMHKKSNGSLAKHDQRTVGSYLIAQKFHSERYFWPRPSAIDYNPLPSGGSNLGPTSFLLKQEIAKRKEALATKDGENVPSELLCASGSGLDPHLSIESALFQTARIAKARNLKKETVEKLIRTATEKRRFGLLGVPRVNVLKLNLALESIKDE